MAECIKWKTPTFTYKGNIASFKPQARSPGKHPRLEAGGATARYMRIEGAEAVHGDLEAVIRAWCADKG